MPTHGQKSKHRLKVGLHWFMFSHLYGTGVEEGYLNISFGHVHHCSHHTTPHVIRPRVISDEALRGEKNILELQNMF